MKKQNQLRTGIFAIAMVLLCNLMAWGQSGKESSPGMAVSASKSQQKNPAANELKNFKADPSNAELSQMRLLLLQAKADLEARLANNSLSQEQITGMNRRISLLENNIKEKSNPDLEKKNSSGDQKPDPVMQRKARNPEAAQKAGLIKALDQKQLTRSEFLTLSEAGQKEVLVKNVNITDLVNGTPDVLKHRQDNVFYIPVADFKGYDISKQIHILKNPSSYVLTENASPAIINSTTESAPVQNIKTYKISRAELNSLSPEKRQAIENSKDFVITD